MSRKPNLFILAGVADTYMPVVAGMQTNVFIKLLCWVFHVYIMFMFKMFYKCLMDRN